MSKEKLNNKRSPVIKQKEILVSKDLYEEEDDEQIDEFIGEEELSGEELQKRKEEFGSFCFLYS